MVRSDTAARVDASRLVLLCVAAWALPGAGHLWLGRRSKGLVVLFALSAMYGVGLALDGRQRRDIGREINRRESRGHGLDSLQG